MNKSDQSGKMFANLSIVLLIIGLLVPFAIAIFSTEESAIGFGVVAVILALIFGILGRKYRSGKASIIIIGILIIWSGVNMLWLKHAETNATQRMQTAEMQHRESQ